MARDIAAHLRNLTQAGRRIASSPVILSAALGAILIMHAAPISTATNALTIATTGALLVLLSLGALENTLARRSTNPKQKMIAQLDRALRISQRNTHPTGLLLFDLDDFEALQKAYDSDQIDHITHVLLSRVSAQLRGRDHVLPVAPGRFAVTLAPDAGLNLETGLQLCKRIQETTARPVHLSGHRVTLTLSAGICLSSRLRDPCGDELEAGAQSALAEAHRCGGGGIRSYSDLAHPAQGEKSGLLNEIDTALKNGQLRAYFQPQISARSGDIAGFEALIRWVHPDRGVIPPGDFLPLLERTGEMSKITHLMISQSLEALQHWARGGVHINRVGINFSTPELMNKDLLSHIEFELDRHGLTADRLAIEVLETVVASQSDDAIQRNLAGLAQMGSCIDLDDFGTGHASITNIQRFSVERIKIDRSFVRGIDQNPEQQNMVTAILTMADRLGLTTLAEGVESEDEHRLLADLGCAYLQGFGIGRPMSLEETDSWIKAYTRHPHTQMTKLRAN